MRLEGTKDLRHFPRDEKEISDILNFRFVFPAWSSETSYLEKSCIWNKARKAWESGTNFNYPQTKTMDNEMQINDVRQILSVLQNVGYIMFWPVIDSIGNNLINTYHVQIILSILKYIFSISDQKLKATKLRKYFCSSVRLSCEITI
jgi:hypothetical protein